jgi:hypothetical protein
MKSLKCLFALLVVAAVVQPAVAQVAKPMVGSAVSCVLEVCSGCGGPMDDVIREPPPRILLMDDERNTL